MKTIPRLFPLFASVCLFPSFAFALSGETVTDEDLSLTRNPIIIRDRLRLGDEFTDIGGGGNSDKLVLAGIYGFGFNGHDRDYGVGFELPILDYNPKGADGGSGVGDFKLRCGHLFMDDPNGWRTGCFFETEFDTAADDVQAIANQRDQMAFGGGASFALVSNFVLSSTLQYGWSLDEGATTGSKSEWEAHLTATAKLTDRISLNLDYKGVVNVMAGSRLFNTLEPSAGWTLGEKKDIGLYASMELPLNETGTNWIAKGGLIWFF